MLFSLLLIGIKRVVAKRDALAGKIREGKVAMEMSLYELQISCCGHPSARLSLFVLTLPPAGILCVGLQ